MLFIDMIDIGFFMVGILVGAVVVYVLEVIRNE